MKYLEALWDCRVGISVFGVFCLAIAAWFTKISLANRIFLGLLGTFCSIGFSFVDSEVYKAFSLLDGLAAIIYLLPIIRDWPEQGIRGNCSKKRASSGKDFS